MARALSAGLLVLGSLAFASPVHATGLDTAAIDRSVKPGEDFFTYANGKWLKATVIPADRANWGPIGILDAQVTQRTRDLLDALDPAMASADALRARRYFHAVIDTPSIEARGLAPLAAGMADIDAIGDAAGLARALGAGVRADVDPLNATNFGTRNYLGLWVSPALHDTTHNMAFLLQGGLSLPDREFYLAESSKMGAIQKRFEIHIARMFTLAGMDRPKERAAGVFALEKSIARAHASREASEDIVKADNVWERAEFAQRAPGLDWDAFLAAAGLGAESRIAVWHPDAFVAQAALVPATPIAVWQDWLRLHALDRAAQLLPKDFQDEHFAFYENALRGIPEPPDRWKTAIDATDAALGDAVGRLYTQRYFPESAKHRAQEMVRLIVAAFDRRIARLRWMAPETRREARTKLKTLYVGIGYPDHGRTYEGLEIRDDDPVGNLERASRFERQRALAKLKAPVDRAEWCMLPQQVNAVNLPVLNALNFPAAILQPPFFDPDAPDAVNYGAMGAVIGHEISHSFDDQGAQFDSNGTLRNWWTPSDLAHFKAASARLVRQFSAYRPFPDAAVNGQQTLSENIADVAGLAAAYDALHALDGGAESTRGGAKHGKSTAGYTRKHGAAAAGAGGKLALTTDQQFFLAFGQAWRSVEREQALREQLVVDGHAPPQYRAQTVRNIDAWYPAFDVRPGQSLYLAPGNRAGVW